jgi:hypothetical protein
MKNGIASVEGKKHHEFYPGADLPRNHSAFRVQLHPAEQQFTFKNSAYPLT